MFAAVKDSVFIPFSETSVEFSCYEFVSFDKPNLNIYNGNEHWFTDSAFEIARNAIPFIAGLVLSGGWSFFIPIGISIVQGVVDYFLEDEIDEFLNDFGDSWNDFWSFSWV